MNKNIKEILIHLFKDHTSPLNPITKKMIMKSFNISDRRTRELIEELRDEGHLIVSSSRYKGYWMNEDDYDKMYIPETINRLNKLSKRVYARRESLRNNPNQMTMEDIGKEMMDSAVADFKSIIGEGEYEWL